MRKKIAALLVAVAGFAAIAQPAAADTTADYSVINYGPSKVFTCTTSSWQAGGCPPCWR